VVRFDVKIRPEIFGTWVTCFSMRSRVGGGWYVGRNGPSAAAPRRLQSVRQHIVTRRLLSCRGAGRLVCAAVRYYATRNTCRSLHFRLGRTSTTGTPRARCTRPAAARRPPPAPSDLVSVQVARSHCRNIWHEWRVLLWSRSARRGRVPPPKPLHPTSISS